LGADEISLDIIMPMNPRKFTADEWPSVLERIKPKNGYPGANPIIQSMNTKKKIKMITT